jgi:hypothetical protein
VSLPWVRLDSSIATHDKILRLLKERDGYRAFTLYICALGYAGGHGTDGFVPREALSLLHGTERQATTLMYHRLWEVDPAGEGYRIRNFDQRQEVEMVRAMKRLGAKKGGCRKNHGPDCQCWKDGL